MFYIDTGAEVTVIPEANYRELKSTPSLSPTSRVLRGPSQRVLSVRGQFTGQIQLGEQDVGQEIYVVVDLHKPLLDRPAIEALSLLKRIRSIEQKMRAVTQLTSSHNSSLAWEKWKESTQLSLRRELHPSPFQHPEGLLFP